MGDNPLTETELKAYWQDRYAAGRTGWDIGYVSPPIRAYLDQLKDRDLRILIPGAGNGYEAEYAWRAGFPHVVVIDIAPAPLRQLQQRVPDFPPEQLIEGDFFTHRGQYDLVLEQTFFCSFPPDPATRTAYARQMYHLLRPGGKLVGLWFATEEVGRPGERPFGGTREEYLRYFSPYFTVRTLAPAHNSIAPRAGRELFGILERREQPAAATV